MQRLLARVLNHIKDYAYNKITFDVINTLHDTANCLDVGCYKGHILQQIIRACPKGRHVVIEPIPHLTSLCKAMFPTVEFHNCALGDRDPVSSFNYVKNAPGFSGLQKRRYDVLRPKIEQIMVSVRRLDSFWKPDRNLHFVKIDVEGAEYQVLEGAIKTIKRNKPVIIFEHGIGASDYYGTTPKMIYELLTGCGLAISVLSLEKRALTL